MQGGAKSDTVVMNMMDTSGSLRERKKAATEAALRRSALALFAAKGYDRTTIEEIVAEADVSRRTFFRYFGSKEEVIYKGATEDIERFRTLLRERPKNETEIESLKQALVAFVKYLEARNAPVLEFVDVILASPTLRARSAELQGRWTAGAAEELAARAGIKLDIKRRLLAAIGIATLTEAIQSWAHGTEVDLGQSVRNSFIVVEDGTLFE